MWSLPSRRGTSPIQCYIRTICQCSMEQRQNISLLLSQWRIGRLYFHDYCHGFAGAFSARLAQCHLRKPQQKRMFIQINVFWLYDFCVRMLLIIFFYVYCYYKLLLFQAWGEYASMSQAVVIYMASACNVFLICWFGTQLTQHVRENGLLLLLILLLLL